MITYCIVKTIIGNSGKAHKSYAAGSRQNVEFRRPGHSQTGVGIDALLTWKTEAGANKFLAQIGASRTDLRVERVDS